MPQIRFRSQSISLREDEWNFDHELLLYQTTHRGSGMSGFSLAKGCVTWPSWPSSCLRRRRRWRVGWGGPVGVCPQAWTLLISRTVRKKEKNSRWSRLVSLYRIFFYCIHRGKNTSEEVDFRVKGSSGPSVFILISKSLQLVWTTFRLPTCESANQRFRLRPPQWGWTDG